MNLFAFSGLLTGITNLLLGIFVYFKNRHSRINQLFAIFSIAVASWGFGGYKVGIASDPTSAFFWWKITLIGVTFIPIFFWHFVYLFLGIKRKKVIILVYFVGLFFLVTDFTDLLVGKTRFVFNSIHWMTAGPVFPLFTFLWFGSIIYVHYELLKAFKKLSGIRKEQIKYFFLGTAFGYIGGGLCFLPVFGIGLYPISNFAVSIYPIIMSYAIVRYRLMDIRLVLGRGAIYLLSFVIVVTLAFLLIFLNSQLAQPLPFNIAGPLIIILSIFLFQFLFLFFEKLASKYFYYTFYSFQAVLAGLGRKLTRVLELDKLSFLIIGTLIDAIKLDKAAIMLREPETGDYQIQNNIGFKEENGISLVKDNFLTIYLEKTQEPLVYEELSLIIRDTTEREEREKLATLQENMKRIEAALCLPLLIEEKIIGIIVLGNKILGDPYSVQDIELLTTLSHQASIALQNARLYSEVEDLSKNLEKKVREQTKKLQKAYEELKVLDKAKSEFISMASHQLRTPLSAIKGYISMILEGSYGNLPLKTKEKLENVFRSNERLIKIVNDLLNISRVELGKIEAEKEKTQIEDLIQSCYEEFKPAAEKKNLKLIWQKPKISLPQIEVDPLKIRQVISNLIDNSLRYTKKGEIEIKAKKADSTILISVKDTGEGLTEEEKKKIFEGFTRGAAGIAHWIEGAGLGLYIAKKFIELHQGKIWAESKGKDRGSTFFIELPVR